MFYLSHQTDKITNEKIELIHKEKYIQASKELFNYLINGDITLLNKSAKELNYDVKKIPLDIKKEQVIYENDISFGKVLIYKKDNIYFLYMKYFDDEFVFFDTTQKKEMEQKETLNYLIVADISLLIILFIILIKMLVPLKSLSNAMNKFGAGDYSFRLIPSKKNDEIGKVTNQFNQMAQSLESLILSRTQLLNDISHELKTPISKAILSLELIEESKYKKILKKSITQIDILTNELLDIEKFNSKHLKLDMQTHSIDTILFESLSKMLIDDEKELSVEIVNLFTCKADLNYISMAIKNLIDNAIKYKTSEKVKIVIDKNFIEVKNRGEALTKELEYYLQTFTQEDSSRGIKGHGLGLNLVKRILDYHGFELKYRYENGNNVFSIFV
jgi:two-component system OmpR family sensor kinase